MLERNSSVSQKPHTLERRLPQQNCRALGNTPQQLGTSLPKDMEIKDLTFWDTHLRGLKQ